MKLSVVTWQSLSAYIFIDRKIDSSSASTLKSRYLNIVKFLEIKDLPFSRSSVNQYIQYKKEAGCKNSYLNNVIKVVSYIHEYLLMTYQYDSGCEKLTYFKREKEMYDILTSQECEQIYNLYYPYTRERQKINTFSKTFFMTLTLTGMRVGEVLNLKWADISETAIRVNETKTNAGRVIPNNPLLVEQLGLQKNYHSEGVYVFPARHRDGHVNKSAMFEDMKKRVKTVGIKKRVWFHLFRHSFCVEMLRHNDVTLVAKLMGHESLASTLNYSHYLLDDMSRAILTHPLLKVEQPFDIIADRIQEFIDKVIDKQNTTVHIEKGKGVFSLTIKR